MMVVRRKIDELGRVVLPREMRELFQLKEHDELDLTADDGGIYITPANARCVLCNSTESVSVSVGHKAICSACIQKIKAD